jgi:hypothetical protein
MVRLIIVISAVEFIHSRVPWSLRMRAFTRATSLVVGIEWIGYYTLSDSWWRVLRVVIIYIVCFHFSLFFMLILKIVLIINSLIYINFIRRILIMYIKSEVYKAFFWAQSLRWPFHHQVMIFFWTLSLIWLRLALLWGSVVGIRSVSRIVTSVMVCRATLTAIWTIHIFTLDTVLRASWLKGLSKVDHGKLFLLFGKASWGFWEWTISNLLSFQGVIFFRVLFVLLLFSF